VCTMGLSIVLWGLVVESVVGCGMGLFRFGIRGRFRGWESIQLRRLLADVE
jgi:hypothetical protein